MSPPQPPRCCDGCGEAAHRDDDGSFIPLKRCARCRQALYHDMSCQKRHYRLHKKSCFPFEIKEMKGRGRGVVATVANFALAATPIQPLVLPVLFDSCRRDRCVVCFGRVAASDGSCWLVGEEFPSICPMRVCSEECQRVGDQKWLLSMEVQCLQVLFSQSQHPTIPKLLPTALMIFRLLLAIENNKIKKEDLMRMQWHEKEALSQEEQVHQQAVVMTVMALVSRTAAAAATNPDQILAILQRVKYNSFTIVDTDDSPLGFSLYSSPAHYFNHSCQPNAAQSFVLGAHTPPRLEICSIRDIAAGQEVCISYQHEATGQSRQARRQYLYEHYNFWCECELCRL